MLELASLLFLHTLAEILQGKINSGMKLKNCCNVEVL